MGLLDKAVSFGTGGLIKDITGSGAAEAQQRANLLASGAETEMFDKNMAFQREMWDWQKQQAQPWQQAGLRGLGGYEDLLQDPSSVTQDPGYQFRLGEGLRGIESSGAAKGMQLSGANLKGLTRFGQDYASNEYDRALGRYQTLANYGQGMTGNIMGQGGNFAGSMGGLYQGQGQNLSNMFMNQGQIQAAQSGALLNNLLGVGNLAASFMSGGAVPPGMAGNTGGGAGNVMGFNPQPMNISFLG